MRSTAMISRLGMSAASLLRACILWLAMTPLAVLHADPLEGALEIDSAFININDGVYQLHAQIRYPVSGEAIVALREGVSLSYDLEVEVFRDRRFWLGANTPAARLELSACQ